MYKYIPAICLLAILPIAVFAQTPTPSPTRDDDVVKITTTLIQVDVTVTDRKGNPVTDLRPEEIEIYENGEKQEITSFSFVSSRQSKAVNVGNQENEIPLPTEPARVFPEGVRRTIALVVDDLSLSFESVHFVKKALTNFVETQMQDGDLVAIIRTEGGVGALQQFTSNKEQLLAAIEKVRWNLRGRARVGAFLPIDGPEAEREGDGGGKIVNVEDDDVEYREDLFATGTLGALNYIVRGMRDLPGRKSVMLLSDGFRLLRKNSRGFVESTRLLTSLERLVDVANRASVVVYTTDARGLQTANFTAADSFGGQNGVFINRALSDRRFELNETQDGLIYLAHNTGGLAFRNKNNIPRAIGMMLDDQSYYLVGYEPDGDVFDPAKRRFNKLTIKVNRPDTQVRYRSGFFGVTDKEAKGLRPDLSDEARILGALTSPFAINDLKLSLHTVYSGAKKKALKVTSFLHIDMKDLKFTKAENGNRKGAFDLLVMNFGDNGVPTDNISKTFFVDIDPDRFEKLLAQGLIYQLEFPIKKPGAYQMRVAIREHGTQKVGSASQFIVIPDPDKDRLTLSGIVVNNVSYEQWNNTAGGAKFEVSKSEAESGLDPVGDSALRRFKAGSVLVYSLEAYNAKTRGGNGPQLVFRTRLVKDGKILHEGDDAPVNAAGVSGSDAFPILGALNLAEGLEPGGYALQVIVTDRSRKGTKASAAQFVHFELVN